MDSIKGPFVITVSPPKSLIWYFDWSSLNPLANNLIHFSNFFLLSFLGLQSTQKNFNIRLDVLSLSILWPSAIYYLGLLSAESITIMFGLLLFLISGSLITTFF